MTDTHGSLRLHAVRVLSSIAVCLSLAIAGCGDGDPVQTTDARTSPVPAPVPAPEPAAAPAPAAPAITAVLPAIGSTTGGDTVTVTGTGLTGATAVRFGGILATGTTVVSDTQVTVTTPAHGAGIVDVEVTTGHGTATMTGAFRYRMAGLISTLAGGGAAAGEDVPATTARLLNPTALVHDRAGNLLVAESAGNRVRVVASTTGTHWGLPMTAGNIHTIAGTGASGSTGDGGPATAASFNSIRGLAFDRDGNLAISESGGHRIRLLAASSGTYFGISMQAGRIYTIAGGGGAPPDNIDGPDAALNQPMGLASDADGNILVAGGWTHRVHVIAARSGTYYGRAMTAGAIYTLAGTGVRGYDLGSAGDGVALSANLNVPMAVLADAHGHVVMADNATQGVRVIAAKGGTYYGVAMTAGHLHTIAGSGASGTGGDGGPPLAAAVGSPSGLAFDAAGNLVISQSDGYVRAIAAAPQTRYGVAMAAGNIYTIAGGGSSTPGDGGPATSASLSLLQGGLAVDGTGQLLVSDFLQNRVRAIAP